MSTMEQLELAMAVHASELAVYRQNRESADRRARRIAMIAAEQVEFWSNKVAMLSVMVTKGM